MTGGDRASSRIIDAGTMTIRAANITKNEGPSPGAATEKSAPQAGHWLRKLRNPEKTLPSPHSGHRHRKPALRTETAPAGVLFPEGLTPPPETGAGHRQRDEDRPRGLRRSTS
jgi:hypothetical protein